MSDTAKYPNTIKLKELGIQSANDRCVVELPNGTVLDIELQPDNELWVDYRKNISADSYGCLPIALDEIPSS